MKLGEIIGFVIENMLYKLRAFQVKVVNKKNLSLIYDNLISFKKTIDALISQIYFVKKIYVFRAVPLPIIRSFSLYQHGTSWSSIPVVLESCNQNYMTYTSAECTVENS